MPVMEEEAVVMVVEEEGAATIETVVKPSAKSTVAKLEITALIKSEAAVKSDF